MIEALKPINDLYGELEPQWKAGMESGMTADERLLQQVLNIYNQIHSRIVQASLAVHTGSSTSFEFWRYLSSHGGWTWDTIQTSH